MYQLPEKLQKLTPYQPSASGCHIRLDANESFLEPPALLRGQIAKAVEAVAFNRYPDPYCTALCEKFAGFFGIDPALTVAGNGSDELIGLLISAFVPKGKTMVAVDPDFSMYAFYASLSGVTVETFTKEPAALALDADALIAFAKAKNAGFVILSNPCNPTSLAASRTDILKIVTGLADSLVVIDEAYMDFSDGSILRLAGGYDNLVVLKTCSKAFGMAAIRLGFAVAPPPVANALRAVKSPYNVNAMTQAAGCALFEQRDYLRGCIGKLKASRDDLYLRLTLLAAQRTEIVEVANTRANFVFVRFTDAKRVFEALETRGVAVRCMTPFLRISAGSARENEALCEALTEILQ